MRFHHIFLKALIAYILTLKPVHYIKNHVKNNVFKAINENGMIVRDRHTCKSAVISSGMVYPLK